MVVSDLAGRTAVITGASRGIGAGLAEIFARRGIRLGLCSRAEPALSSSPEVVARTLDVRDEGALEAFARDTEAQFGAIDLWINNAGVLKPVAPLRDVDVAEFREHLDINLTGVFLGSRTFVRHVRAREGAGVLINISSAGAWAGFEGWSAYCAGKAGVAQLTQCVAMEEAASGVRAHAVAPGVVNTDMQALIRSTPEDRFPGVDYFIGLERDGGFNSIEFVAQHILELVFDPDKRTDEVDIRLPSEQDQSS
jgi:NAD(P)-dependent dehydrogenase (short-subunit alcohol dehydrogenase family)